jgi:hypothetical protein
MSEVTNSNWFPVLTLLLGFVAKGVSDWIDYKRNAAREAKKLKFELKQKLYDRRVEFQRQTLLDLQDAVAKLGRFAGATYMQDLKAFKATGEWQKQRLSEDLDKEFTDTQRMVRILCVRLRDVDARQLVGKFSNECAMIGICGKDESDKVMERMSLSFDELNNRIGELLREIDNDE